MHGRTLHRDRRGSPEREGVCQKLHRKTVADGFWQKGRTDLADYQLFLVERCFPQSRAHSRQILRDMGLDFFDPEAIIQKTRAEWPKIGTGCCRYKIRTRGFRMREIDIQNTPPATSTGHSSKGNQFKWPADGGWYKADHMGYESLAEIIVSRLLQQSEMAYPHVLYEPAVIHYDGHTLRGCFSENFLPENREIVTLEKLFRQYTGAGLSATLAKIPEVPDKIRRTVDTVVEITGLEDFGIYLTTILEADAIFLNEDRHTNNIAVLYDAENDGYACCPLFDFGLALFSDTGWDFPLDAPLDACYKRIAPKPFARTFNEQMEAAEELYGIHLTCRWGSQQLEAAVQDLTSLYTQPEIERVVRVLREQKRRYDAFFKE